MGGRTVVGVENRMFEHSIKHVRHTVHLAPGHVLLVKHSAEDKVSLGLAVVNARPVSPMVHREEQSCRKILLPISGGRIAQFSPAVLQFQAK